MEREYTTSTGYKIFYGAIAIALVGFTIFIPLSANNGNNFEQSPALIIIPILGIIGAAAIIINLTKRKIVVTDYSVSRTNIWGTKEIINKDVKGFRVGDKAIFIYPADEGYSKLAINDYISIGDDKGLITLLGDKFKNLDTVEFEESKQEILHDATLGPTEQDREQLFNNTRKYTNIYSAIGIGLLFIPMVFNYDNLALGVLLLIYPLVGLVMLVYGKGLITLVGKKSSAYASIFSGIAFPAMGLIFQTAINDKIVDYDKLWWPAAIVGLIMFAILYLLAVKKAKDMILTQLIFALVIAGAYGFGSVLEVNCGFDKSQAKVFQVTVIDHYINHGKSTSYHLTLDEWDNHPSESISVPGSFYDNEPVGAKVSVCLKQGTLNIPWFYVTQ